MQTVQVRCEETLEVNKSKFVAIILPFNDANNFKKLLAEIKKEHTKAKHIVYAFRVKDKSKSCDDQEQKGTAGRTLLEFFTARKDQVVFRRVTLAALSFVFLYYSLLTFKLSSMCSTKHN